MCWRAARAAGSAPPTVVRRWPAARHGAARPVCVVASCGALDEFMAGRLGAGGGRVGDDGERRVGEPPVVRVVHQQHQKVARGAAKPRLTQRRRARDGRIAREDAAQLVRLAIAAEGGAVVRGRRRLRRRHARDRRRHENGVH
eukprot:3268073-Prymnesium_polylepis.1